MIGSRIKVSILQCEDGKVKIGIDAPENIKIHREEVYNEISEENREASRISLNRLSELKKLSDDQ
jgi:carbon storage regulator